MRALLSWYSQDSSGSTIATVAIALPVVLGLASGAMTFSAAVSLKDDLQEALDAAVLAAASLPNDAGAGDRIERAGQVFDANPGVMTKRFARSDAPTISAHQTIEKTFAVTNGARVAGTASAALQFPFAHLVSVSPITVSVHSAADRSWSGPICLLALNGSAMGGFDLNGSTGVSAPDCAAMTNSNDPAAMRIVGAATAQASEFGVTGGGHGDGFTPPPVTGVAPIDDPFADVPLPPIGPCVEIANKLQQVHLVLGPGTYCEDINIKAQSTVEFLPGIYVINNSMLKIDSDAVVTGEEVMFAFTGKLAKLWFSSGAAITLTAPRSGPYAGFQFFQAADDMTTEGGWATIIGGVNLHYDGVFYFPHQHIWIAGGSQVTARTSNYAMVADKLWFQDSSQTKVEFVDNPDQPQAQRFAHGTRLVE